MQRAMLQLIITDYAEWLRSRFPVEGQPCLHDFLARCMLVIQSMPDEALPESKTPQSMTVQGVRESIDRLFLSLVRSNSGNTWAELAIHSMNLLAEQAVPRIVELLLRPSSERTILSLKNARGLEGEEQTTHTEKR